MFTLPASTGGLFGLYYFLFVVSSCGFVLWLFLWCFLVVSSYGKMLYSDSPPPSGDFAFERCDDRDGSHPILPTQEIEVLPRVAVPGTSHPSRNDQRHCGTGLVVYVCNVGCICMHTYLTLMLC